MKVIHCHMLFQEQTAHLFFLKTFIFVIEILYYISENA